MVDVWYTAGTPVIIPASKDFNYQFKIVLVGEASVGKSSFLRKYYYGNYKRNSPPGMERNQSSIGEQHLGLDVIQKKIRRAEKTVKLTIWDTAGQERYRSLTQSYYRDARGCFIVFDVTNPESFDKVATWHQEVRKYTGDLVEIIIVGAMSQDYSRRKVSQERAESKAYHLNCKYMDISAETGSNVRLAFETMTDAMLAHEVKPKVKSLTDSWKEHNERISLKRPSTKKNYGCSVCSC